MLNMKILFVEPHESSLFSFRKELLDRLIYDGHNVVLCTELTNKTKLHYENKVKIIDVPVDLKSKNIRYNLKLLKKYGNIIRSEKPDLIISFKIKPNIYCGFFAKKIPMIANITGLGNLFKKESLSSLIGIFLYKIAFKNVDYIFFQNTDGLEFFKKRNIKVNNYRIVPGSGVNISLFLPTSIKKHEITQFLFASRAFVEKGFDLLLNSIPLVISQNKRVHFNFMSSKDEFFTNTNAQNIYYKYSTFISILPRTSSMSTIYSNNDFLVSPSYYREGISNVLLESLACGRPIITTCDNPGCKEVLIDGVNGIGVVSNDLNSLVAALLKASFLDKKVIEKMGLEGRRFVQKNFNRKIVVRNYIEVIDIINNAKK